MKMQNNSGLNIEQGVIPKDVTSQMNDKKHVSVY